MLMLVAYGNELEVPCVFFRDMAEAMAFTRKWMIPKYSIVPNDGPGQWRVHGVSLDPVLADALFSRYYGGCGEALAFELKAVPFGQACVPWDLD